MPTLESKSSKFDYSVVRTSRRTIAIHIDPLKGVLVRAPKRASEKEVRKFLLQKAPWIMRKLVEVQRRAGEVPHHLYLDGEIFLYRGESFRLRICTDSGIGRNSVAITGSEIAVSLKPGQNVQEILRKWYIARARETLNERVKYFSGELDAEPNKIVIRGQTKRWGSCSSKGNVNLNWKLVMAQPNILDYVVAHELCHLRFPNHQAEFWHTLSGVMPDYTDRRAWLKANGHKLVL